jgi:hypothetical protein
LGDPVCSDDKQCALAIEEDVLPCIAAKGVFSMGGDVASKFGERDLGNATRLVWAGECRVFAMGGGEFGPRPALLDDITERCDGPVIDGPVLVILLDPEDSGVQVLIQGKGGAELGLGGGVEGIDVVGDEAYVRLMKGGER